MGSELLISNVMLDGMIKLNKKLQSMRISNGFGTWEQYLIDPDNYGLAEFSCIVILLDGEALKSAYKDPADVINILSRLRNFSKQHREIRIYLSNIRCRITPVIDIYDMLQTERFESEINTKVYELCTENDNIICLNLRKILETMGEADAYSSRMEYMSSCPYSIKALRSIVDELVCMDYFRGKQRKKCLIVDLDNTLWGGVIAEEGYENILLSDHKEGKQYYDFQKMVLKIKSTGIILAVSSKNNMEDAESAFNNPAMLLKKSDFVAKRINWNPKSVSIDEIAKELNIGLDSIVFVDDNPLEREKVKKNLPEVTVPDFPEDVTELEKFGLSLYNLYFRTDRVLEEDIDKTGMYIANSARNKLKETAGDLNSFIRSLEIELTIKKASPDHLQRIAQMTQKTNQFNLTTRRYTEAQINEMLSDVDQKIYIGAVKDKFGDNGITILCIVKRNGSCAYIDELLMSCRVMERLIEYDFMRFIENDLLNSGITEITGEFIKTKKNAPASSFFEKYGFEKDSNSELYKKEVQKQQYSGLINVLE